MIHWGTHKDVLQHLCRILILIAMFWTGLGQIESRAYPTDDQVRIEDVRVVMSASGPVVLLMAQQRVVPIFVDPTVAGSIDGALTGLKYPRPLSHDLMHSILDSYGGTVSRVVIQLKGQVFYGALTISLDGHTKIFDSRSSDAIALAIHFDAPIFVGKDLLEEAGELPPDSGNRHEL